MYEKSWAASIAQLCHRDLDWMDTVSLLVKQMISLPRSVAGRKFAIAH